MDPERVSLPIRPIILVQKRAYCALPEGAFNSESSEGIQTLPTAGMTYLVPDDFSAHRSYSEHGARLLILDGDFLKPNS